MRYSVSDLATDDMYTNLFIQCLKTCGISGEKVVDYLIRNTDNSIIVSFGKQCATGYDKDDLYYQLVPDYTSWYNKLEYQFGTFADAIDEKFPTACREYRDACKKLAFTTIETWR